MSNGNAAAAAGGGIGSEDRLSYRGMIESMSGFMEIRECAKRCRMLMGSSS